MTESAEHRDEHTRSDPAPTPALVPSRSTRCFGCNHDLSATPAEANCPECGLSGPDRRSHATSEYLRQLRTGLWLVFIGTAVGLAVSLWLWLVPESFLDWIDGIGWADRIVPRRWMAMRSVDLAASACVLVGLWRFFARPPSAATHVAAARGLLDERFRRALRVMVVLLGLDFAQYAARTIVPWFSDEWSPPLFTWLSSGTGQTVMQVNMWVIFVLRAVVWLSAGFLALRLARRLADERLELALLVALWAVPLFSFGGPWVVWGVLTSVGADISDLALAIPVLLSEAAIAALAFCLHRRLKAASATPSPRPTPVVE